MLKGVGEEHFMDIFVNGLKEEIGAQVKLYGPKSLCAMVKKAIMVEQKNRAMSKAGVNTGGRYATSFRSPSIQRSVTVETGQRSGMKGLNTGISWVQFFPDHPLIEVLLRKQ